MPVANVKTVWTGGKLDFTDKSYTAFLELDGDNLALDILSGGTLKLAGTAITATAAQINAAAAGSPVVGVATKSADYSLLAADSGKLIVVTGADKVLTLPATAAGLYYRVTLAAAGLSAGTGLQIAPQAADKIMGNGFTSADNKAAVLAGSGDREGDSITLVADGVDGWYIASVTGTWTRAA